MRETPFFTVGHSTLEVEDFVDLLRLGGVEHIVDVRKMPRSRSNPQFNTDVLGESLGRFQIGYEHITELGGLRGRQRPREPSPNPFWENRSFRNYSHYALTESFQSGMARLETLGARRRVAVMCAEAVWWRCHRRIIADHLIARGGSVFHLLQPRRVEPARLTPGAAPTAEGGVVYPGEAG